MDNCGGSSVAEQASFQMLGGGSIPTPSLQFRIAECAHSDAKAFIETWHYSKKMPTGKNYNYGLYDQHGYLYAVIVYGIGVNPYQAKFLNVETVIEIKRMARREPRKNYNLSRLIRLTMKFLQKKTQFDCVVAFADPEQGHEGTVYKAAGFVYAGETNPEWHLMDENGVTRHRRFAYRYARRNGVTISKAREELKLIRRKTEPKHRWVCY